MKLNKILGFATASIAFASTVNAATLAGSDFLDGTGGDTIITQAAGITGAGLALSTGIASTGYFTVTDSVVDGYAATYSDITATALARTAAKNSLIAAFVGLAGDDFSTGWTNSGASSGMNGSYTLSADLGLLGTSYAGLNKVLYTFWGNTAVGYSYAANTGTSTALTGSTAIGLARHTGVTLDRDDNVATPDSNDAGLNNPYVALIRGAQTSGTYDTTPLLAEAGSATQSATAFQLVSVVPETSTALLGAIGALGLLRRRRN